MTDTAVSSALTYYARHACALFPIPYGSKNPTGIISSFAHDYSTDPAQWSKWCAEHKCNFGLISGPSRVIIADVDVSEIGRDRAWQIWSDWWTSRGLAVPTPHTQSARGGWHTLFALPADVDIATLRQVPLIGAIEGVSTKAIVDLRVGNGFVVAAGSFYDGTAKGEESGHYLMMSDAPPHLAPAELLEHCKRAEPTRTAIDRVGTRDKGDVAALLSWLSERGQFDDYDSWLNAGMACKLEYGDAGMDLWAVTFNDTVTPDVATAKWDSFSADPTPGCVTLNSFLAKAHALGWRGQVRKSTASMFDGVAQIAAAAGATLASQMPTPGGAPATGMPMLAGQEELARLGQPFLDEFIATSHDAPKPISDDYPTLPAAMSGHGLYEPMVECISRIMGLAETKQPPLKVSRLTDVLIVLGVLHNDIFEAVKRRLTALGYTLPERKIKLGITNFSEKIERITVTHDKWEYDMKSGDIQSDNPDNVIVFLGVIGCEVRWNLWLHRMEIIGGSDVDLRWQDWTAIDDTIIDKLLTRAKRTKTRFKPTDTFLRSTLNSISHDNPHDPVVEFVNSLQWDGQSRLGIWLTAACGVPCDPYYQAVGKNVIGGMVKRIRKPGAKHDEVMILMGPQGTSKSTLCRVLAMRDEWFTDSVTFDGSPQNIVPQLFGKMVVELAELDGMAKKEVQSIKRFISAQSDNVTLKYEKFATDRARRCIFIGTSNEDAPLVDVTGNRRFLPVRLTGEINITWLRANIEQMVAEAAHLEAQGADFAIPREIWNLAAKHQESARSISDIEVRFSEWFAETEFTKQAFVATQDLGDLTDMLGLKRIEGLRNAIMKQMGFRECQPYIDGKKMRGWYRGPDMLPRHIGGLPRFMVGSGQDGRPRVTIRSQPITTAASAPLTPPPLPGGAF